MLGMSRALVKCVCVSQGGVCVCECAPFTGPEQQIVYLHMCELACEHLCKHLHHGRRTQWPGHEPNAWQRLEPRARGRCCAEGEQVGARGMPSMSSGRETCPSKRSQDEAIPQGFPVPGTCADVTFHGSRDFAEVMKLRLLRWGAYPGLLGWAQRGHRHP